MTPRTALTDILTPEEYAAAFHAGVREQRPLIAITAIGAVVMTFALVAFGG